MERALIATDSLEIRFFHPGERYGFLSNYFEYRILLDKFDWRTAEHYYQSKKFLDPEIQEHIRQLKTAGGAKAYAHSRRVQWRPDWDRVKMQTMRKAVLAKFDQSAFLSRELFLTGSAVLIEASPSDYFWGCGEDETGANWLGIILMEVRDALNCR